MGVHGTVQDSSSRILGATEKEAAYLTRLTAMRHDRDARAGWFMGWGAVALLVLIAVIIDWGGREAGPAVLLFLLAALVGVGLNPRICRKWVGSMALLMVASWLLKGVANHDFDLLEGLERLTGLICLGVLLVLEERQLVRFPFGTTGTSGLTGMGSKTAARWRRRRASEEDSILVDLKDLGEAFLRHHGGEQGCTTHGPVTSELTQVRQGAEVPSSLRLPDSDLSFDDRSCHSDAEKITGRLRDSGRFDHDQLELIRSELRDSMVSRKPVNVGTPLQRGMRIGRFVVEEPLGSGGEGNVYRGHDVEGEPAAIKILHNTRVSDRFRREMHLVRQLAHPNIVTAYEVGEYDGLPFITMELLRGPDLHILVRDHGPLDWRVSSQYVLQAAHALSHAHRRDLIHRDIKPGNLILDGDHVVKLVDLGLASMVGGETGLESVIQVKTKDGHLAGTLPYMAPEQARSLAKATIQSDIYGLGATWFYLLTGKERLCGKTFSQQFENLIVRRRFHSLPNSVMPESLRQIYRRMTAYDRRDRYPDCQQLAEDLEAALVMAGESVSAIEGIHVLVVEDSRTDMMLAIEMLRRSNSSLSIHEARSLADGLQVCSRLPIDLVLLDLSLPDSSGVETVTRFRRAVRDVPLVVLTGLTHQQVGAACLAAGANTFISKTGLTPHRMERTIFVTLSRCGLSRRNNRGRTKA